MGALLNLAFARIAIAIACLAWGACRYSPVLSACVPCADAGTCPRGYVCRADGHCAARGDEEPCAPTERDAAPPPPPPPAPPPDETCFAAIDAGARHTCALTRGGAVWCWGQNHSAQAGTGLREPANLLSPTRAAGENEAFVDVSAGDSFTCARKGDGSVWCWGWSFNGQTGQPLSLPRPSPPPQGPSVPTRVPDLPAAAVIAAGADSSYAVSADGALFGWGVLPGYPDGTGTPRAIPAPQRITGVAAGTFGVYHYGCAIAADGDVLCWGENRARQLGGPTPPGEAATPLRVPGLPAPVTALSAGDSFTCAITRDGALYCWGVPDTRVGMAAPEFAMPRLMPGFESDVAEVALGSHHACVRTTDGRVRCWGENERGQRGDGFAAGPGPTLVPGLTDVVDVTSGADHSCAVVRNGSAYCWGVNGNGQLGTGQPEGAGAPVRVQAACSSAP